MSTGIDNALRRCRAQWCVHWVPNEWQQAANRRGRPSTFRR